MRGIGFCRQSIVLGIKMKTLRYSCSICAIIIVLGIAATILLPLVPLNNRYYSCVLGLLTGLISGAFLAVVTSLCELKIRSRKQKAMLRELCLTLSGCLKQLTISFASSQKYGMSPKYYSSNLGCINGPGIHCANLICAEIGDDLFVGKKKTSQLNELRGIAMNMGQQVDRLNCECKILNNKMEIIELKQRGVALADDQQVDELRHELAAEVEEFLKAVDSMGNEFIYKIDCAILAIYGQANLEDFRSQLLKITDNITPQVDEIIKQSVLGQRSWGCNRNAA